MTCPDCGKRFRNEVQAEEHLPCPQGTYPERDE